MYSAGLILSLIVSGVLALFKLTITMMYDISYRDSNVLTLMQRGETFRNDKRWLKAFVAIAWAVDTVHQALTLKVGYVYLVTQFGNIDYIGVLNP